MSDRCSKSYWAGVAMHSEADQEAVLSWFHGLADGMVPYRAQGLFDKWTDRQKKLRVFAIDAKGRRWRLTRTETVRGHTIEVKAA